MIGTVTARESVDSKSIDAVSDWEDLYRTAKSTTTVARGKLQQNNAHARMDSERCANAWFRDYVRHFSSPLDLGGPSLRV